MDNRTFEMHNEAYNQVITEDVNDMMRILCFDPLFRAMSKEGNLSGAQWAEIVAIRLKDSYLGITTRAFSNALLTALLSYRSILLHRKRYDSRKKWTFACLRRSPKYMCRASKDTSIRFSRGF